MLGSVGWEALSGNKSTEVTQGEPPYASVSVTNSALSKDKQQANARYIYDFLTQPSQGFTKEAACGVLGNMSAESDFDPGVWEAYNDTDSGYGLVQWTPVSEKFLKWANKEGYISGTTAQTVNGLAEGNENPNSQKQLMDAELAFLMADCANTATGVQWFDPHEAGAYFTPHTDIVMTFEEYKTGEYQNEMLDASTLAVVFHDHYERSNDTMDAINKNRAGAANYWFENI